MRQPPRPRTKPAAAPRTGATPKAAPRTGGTPKAAPRTGATPKAAPRTGATPKAVPARTTARVVAEPPAAAAPARVSTAMADRLAERTAMRRHRRWRRVLAWLLALVAAAALAWAVFWSPALALDPAEVTITGEGTTIDVEEVRAAVVARADVPLPRLDTVALRAEILGMRGVKDVRIARVWPQGLDVALTSREPVAAVPTDGGFALLDPEGIRVGTAEAAPEGLAVVDVPLDDGSARALQAALRVLAALPPELSDQVASVRAETQDDVETVLRDGRSVRWGGASRVALKVEVVRTLLEVEPGARVVDVSSPELPVTQ
ncbi:cell division protein FtsQ/DivIB [Isoptericola variabilis]|uniref:Cell division protein FtsQ n=1 Tax=Isoptericola variabilis (strain 225) TaxID=743718 RepID=F6FSJ4_ISOV2|nr:cell division protein FtsQ/DivIB [Isoptericola variabilis]AEG44061.1 cell division protein FtsQ [Isoptericola variabilis 225]